MKTGKYYSEEELVEKVQSGEFGWLDYINYHSPEWQEEYTSFCIDRGLNINEASAQQFMDYKDELMEEDMGN